MLELLSDPAVWAAFLTLTVMEIVLGIDNIVFISVLVSRLPKEMADRARQIGIALALIFRIALLFLLTWIIGLGQTVISAWGLDLSWRDLILLAGGLFLIYKATHEMHAAIEEPREANVAQKAGAVFSAVIVQIILIDMVFSVDSILTAIGMAEHVEVMVAAVVVAVGVMFVASGPIADFVAKHPTTKILALAFLLLIGVTLVAEGLGFHIPKGYIYSAMAFSVLVEAVNILAKQRRDRHGDPARLAAATHVPGSRVAPEEVEAAIAAKPRPRPRNTPQNRSQSRPKSAPRKPRGS